ncbi:hypothetical protein HYZ97_05075 [Candidatus Pacearchaeota archaeon]|nr:hypothetical protein [Candidatus Pacearchaeota archaeon]
MNASKQKLSEEWHNDVLEEILLQKELVQFTEALIYARGLNMIAECEEHGESLDSIFALLSEEKGERVSQEEKQALLTKAREKVNTLLESSDVSLPTLSFYRLTPGVRLPSLIAASLLSAGSLITPYNEVMGGGLMGAGMMQAMLAGFFYLRDGSNASYFPRFAEVSLPGKTREKVLSGALHEYTHHVQHTRGLPQGHRFSMMCEGHAKGVEHHLASQWSDEEGALQLKCSVELERMAALAVTAEWMREKLAERGEVCTPRVLPKSPYSMNETEMEDYVKGSTFFQLLQYRHGPGIYKKVLQGNVSPQEAIAKMIENTLEQVHISQENAASTLLSADKK